MFRPMQVQNAHAAIEAYAHPSLQIQETRVGMVGCVAAGAAGASTGDDLRGARADEAFLT